MRLAGFRPRRRTAETTLVALVDVVFLLILFFVLTGHFERLRLLSLGAVGTAAAAPAQAATGRLVVLRVEAPNQLSIDGASLSMDELPPRLRGVADVIVKVAPTVSLGDLVRVVDGLRDAGIADFQLLEG